MLKKRRYDDFCAAAHALDIVGERWALLIVRELILGARRFSDLRSQLGRISANVLTQRLNELEASGVLTRLRLAAPASTWAYALTPWGMDLEPVILELVRWGVRSPAFARGQDITADAFMLSLKAMFAPLEASSNKLPGPSTLRIALTIGDQPYCATIEQGTLDIQRDQCMAADATIAADTPALLRLAYGRADLADLAACGAAQYGGDPAALRQFFSMFKLPAVQHHPASVDPSPS